MLDTIEMDLMMAQIGELATEVQALRANAGGGGGGTLVNISNLRPASQTSFNADSSMFSWEIYNKLLEGKTVQAVIDLTALGGSDIYFANISQISPNENKESITAYAYIAIPGTATGYSLTIYGSQMGQEVT